MSSTDPYHTVMPEERPELHDVYHDRTECPDGSHIEKEYWRQGRAGREQCEWCKAH
jgi:hypothetical protein